MNAAIRATSPQEPSEVRLLGVGLDDRDEDATGGFDVLQRRMPEVWDGMRQRPPASPSSSSRR